MCGSCRVQLQGPCNSRCERKCALGDVIESLRAYRSHLAEAALDLVGDSQRRQKFAAAALRKLTGGQHGSDIVAGMTCLSSGQKAIIEIQIANQSAIEER